MSSGVCNAAEIAEKRRLALQKLQARNNANKNVKPPTANMGTSSVNNFYKSTTNVSKINTANQVNTSAAVFLNSLKRSNIVPHRKELRDSSHPYQRNAQNPESLQTNIAQHTSKETTKPQQLAAVFVKTVTCELYMISAQRFIVQPSGYHDKLIDVFKSIPNKAYDQKTRLWSFDIKEYALVQERVGVLKPNVAIGTIPKSVLSLCLAPPRTLNYSCLASIEPTLAFKLLPFQQEGVCFTIAQHGRMMICDEMGLGKTYQALAVADFYREDWPLLICTTATIRESWALHIRELLPSIPLACVQVFNSNQQCVSDAKVLITSYSLMERHMSKLTDRKFGFVIFDESQMLKNYRAKCTAVASRLAMQAKHIVLLSGTPALSRPLELFTQLQMVDRKFMNFKDFTTRYCAGKQTHFGWDATGQSNLEELNVVLKLKYMLRRTKAEVLPEMSEKFRETVVLDPALVWQNGSTEETLNEYTKTFNASKGRKREEILLQFYSETAKVKARAVCAYLKHLIKEKSKFIVFAHHHTMLDAICNCLHGLIVNFVRIDGSTRNDQRAELIDVFQKNSDCRVAVLSLKACNSGITLTAANMIVFAELDWNPSTLAQAESRAHRIGQDQPVTCRYLLAAKTADDIIWRMLKNKQDILNKAGLFCENLQDATHTTAPTSSHKIDEYFSPSKLRNSMPQTDISLNGIENCSSLINANEIKTTENACLKVEVVPDNSKISTEIEKECEHIAEFFDDDDDEAFKDLKF